MPEWASGAHRSRLAALGTLAVAASLSGGCLGVASAAADTLYVSGSGGSDANNCLAPTTACKTVQHAVDEATAGDAIEVGPGTYEEIVSVTKSLTLRGAQAGADARDRTGAAESVLDASGGGFVVSASNVTIDGFTIEGVSGPPFGVGIYLSPSHSGYHVVDNVVRDNILGLYANTSGTSPSLIERNRFEANNRPGSASGNAVYADQATHDLAIEENLFTGHESAAAVFAGSDQAGITMSDNELIDDNSIAFFGTEEATVRRNTSAGSQGSIVFLGGGNDDIRIEGNRFLDGATSAIRVVDSSTGPNQNVEVTQNVISGNAFGVRVDDAAHAGPLEIHGNSITANTVGAQTLDPDPGDAIQAGENWWGCNEGPGQPGCDSVSSGVITSPWLVLSASAAPASIANDETATVTARLDRNSEGEAASAPVADTVLASFAATLGTMSPPLGSFVGGVATSTYSAGGSPGDAGVSVTVDNETVPTALSVRPTASIAPPLPPARDEPVIKTIAERTLAAGTVVVLGTIACPDARCAVYDRLATLAVGGESYRLKFLVPRVMHSGSAGIRIFLRRVVREALREESKASLVARLTVGSDDGDEIPVRQQVALRPKR